MPTQEYPYKIYNPAGELVLQAPESCRHPKLVELALVEAGYSISLNGRKLTKTALRRSASDPSA